MTKASFAEFLIDQPMVFSMANHDGNRSVLAFVNFLSWCAVVGGFFLAIYLAGKAPEHPFGGSNFVTELTYMTPGMMVTLAGLVGVALSAVGLATVDTAQSNEELVRIMKDFVTSQRMETQRAAARANPQPGRSLNVPLLPGTPSEAAAEATAAAPVTVAPVEPAPPPSPPRMAPPKPEMIEHLGRRIDQGETGWKVGELLFADLAKAKAHIEATTLRAQR